MQNERERCECGKDLKLKSVVIDDFTKALDAAHKIQFELQDKLAKADEVVDACERVLRFMDTAEDDDSLVGQAITKLQAYRGGDRFPLISGITKNAETDETLTEAIERLKQMEDDTK